MIELSRYTFEEIKSRMEDSVGYDDASWREDYSGRGMYGRECPGITTDNPMQVVMAFAATLAIMEAQEEYDTFPELENVTWDSFQVRTDSMGLSTIVYFPNMKIID